MQNQQDKYFANGHIERLTGGKYEGAITIEGVSLSRIVGVYFKEEGEQYLWLKRKRVIEYDYATDEFKSRLPSPMWECYMKRIGYSERSIYKGEFTLFHFKYSITGIWDDVFTRTKKLNLFVERLPREKQTIINKIRENNAGKV